MLVPNNYLNAIVGFAEEHGVGRRRLLASAGVRQETLDAPDARVDYEQFQQLIKITLEDSGRRCLGLELGSRLTITNHGLLGYAAMSSATLGEALAVGVKYVQTRLPVIVATQSVRHRTARIRLEEAAVLGEVRPTVLELVVAAFNAMALFLTKDAFKYSELVLAYEEPEYVEEYRRLFDCRLTFGAEVTELRFDAALLSMALPYADEVAKRQAAQRCEEELAAIAASDDLEQQVRVRLLKMDMSESVPELAQLAADLGLSPRTLRRRLHDSDTAYQRILNSVRKELAVQYLRAGTMSVCEIADRLGYSDQSAFGRAFKGWTGLSPRNFIAAD